MKNIISGVFTNKLISFSVFGIALLASVTATYYSLIRGWTLAYGDTESHLNIAKRVIESLTPGMAQLGGIWLPLPHLLLTPFVYFDFLWRTGLAGSIVSGLSYIVSSIFIFRIGLIITKSHLSSFVVFLAFALNPNILYLQSTAMTELPLIAFFLVSSYFFLKYILAGEGLLDLVLAALFGFFASLSRYDGWFLVLSQAGVLFAYQIQKIDWRRPINYSSIKEKYFELEGKLIIFSVVAFLGIFLWFAWDTAILGDLLYFTHSQYSANSQQQNWLSRGELPAYHNLLLSVVYFLFTAQENIGYLIFAIAVVGLTVYLASSRVKSRFLVLLILAAPVLFNIATLYFGQSVIFIPPLTPNSFEWQLFNTRYGVMAVPLLALLFGFAFYRLKNFAKVLMLGGLAFQLFLFYSGTLPTISLEDGISGLSSAKHPQAQDWLAQNYDGGLVLLDDYARTVSIIKSGVPMKNVIYVGNKPYWEESLVEPQKYARWVVMQKDDTIWDRIYENETVNGRLFKYFQKVYTSNEILIFKKAADVHN